MLAAHSTTLHTVVGYKGHAPVCVWSSILPGVAPEGVSTNPISCTYYLQYFNYDFSFYDGPTPAVVGLPSALGQQDVVLPSPLIQRDTRGVFDLATLPQQLHQSNMPLQAYASYAMGPPQVSFFSQLSFSLICLYMLTAHYGVCFLLSGFHVDASLTYGGSTIGVCTEAAIGSLPMAGMCACWFWSTNPSTFPTCWGGIFFSRFGFTW